MLTHIFICPLRYQTSQTAVAPPLHAPPLPTPQPLRSPSYVVPPRVLLRRHWLRLRWLRYQPFVLSSLRLPTHPLAGAGGFGGLFWLFSFDDFRTSSDHLRDIGKMLRCAPQHFFFLHLSDSAGLRLKAIAKKKRLNRAGKVHIRCISCIGLRGLFIICVSPRK